MPTHPKESTMPDPIDLDDLTDDQLAHLAGDEPPNLVDPDSEVEILAGPTDGGR